MRQATATFSRKRPGQNVVEGAPFKPGELIANRYDIKDTVGAGPLGFVFRAHDKEIDVEVALKVIHPRLLQTAEERRAFAKVIHSARKLSHPNLARVYEEGEDKDRPFFSMQFLEGLSLRKIIDLRLSKGQFFSLREIEPILTQVGAALEGAHKVGPHSDLKPENVVVLPDLLKVTDFGVGLAMPRLPFVQAVKARKADRYLAPEFVEGGEIDHRADIFSLGVILGEMLSGLTPDGAIPELGRRNPEVPPAVEGLYRRALNQNPLARFKSAQEMVEELADISRRVLPPPLKSKPEPASEGPSSRPRPGGGAALQLSPRRTIEKPPPPVPESALLGSESDAIQLESGEVEALPSDATQPVDSSQLPSDLFPPSPPPESHEPTEVVLSGPSPARDHERPEPLPPPRPQPNRSRSAIWLLVLTVSGLITGSAGGYFVLQKMRQRPPTVTPPREDSRAREEERRKEAERLAEERRLTLARQKAEEERRAAE
ncbi:MAG: serine/threonine protein kinase, partial [Myxococcota bacterium]